MTKRIVAILSVSIVACFLVLLRSFSVDWTRAHHEAQCRTAGSQALRAIAVVMLEHTEQHSGAQLKETSVLSREIAKTGISLISPNERTANAKYSFIRVLPASPLDPRDIMIYEKPENYGGAGTNVTYPDGHLLWLTPLELQQELADIAKRRGLATSQPTTAPIEIE